MNLNAKRQWKPQMLGNAGYFDAANKRSLHLPPFSFQNLKTGNNTRTIASVGSSIIQVEGKGQFLPPVSQTVFTSIVSQGQIGLPLLGNYPEIAAQGLSNKMTRNVRFVQETKLFL